MLMLGEMGSGNLSVAQPHCVIRPRRVDYTSEQASIVPA